jgi:cephalosporin hydroxylase
LGVPDAASGASAGPGSLNPYLSVGQQRVVDAFHDLYYSLLNEGRGVDTNRLSWLGTELFKCPMDLWLYQELIAGNRPDVIIETGTYRGGSAHYLATMCELVGHGEVVSIDVNPWSDRPRPRHDRLSYLTGSSVDAAMLADVRQMVGSRSNVLVILDSDHSLSHVLAELRLYQQFVPVGGLMVVEDTNVNGHPTFRDHGPGPWEAVDAFLTENRDFIADRGLERFLLTMNPRGYLRRVARSAASQG